MSSPLSHTKVGRSWPATDIVVKADIIVTEKYANYDRYYCERCYVLDTGYVTVPYEVCVSGNRDHIYKIGTRL